MSETTELYLNVARKWMLDSKESVVVLPAGLCNTLTQAWDKDKVAFKTNLDKLDMELTVTPDTGESTLESVLTLTLTFYPSMECFGTRTAVIYISPSFLSGAMRRVHTRDTPVKTSFLGRVARWMSRARS